MQNNNSTADEFTPTQFFLSQNYPNPFNEKTVIKYCVPLQTKVHIAIYNTHGEMLKVLVDEIKNPGTYEVEFATCHSGEVSNLPDGYYFYKMITEEFSSEKKWFCINHLFGRLNMKTLMQTLFFFFLITQICFGQWYPQNSGTTQHLNRVQFVDANIGWAVGDSGLILYTSNGGSSWIQQLSGIQLPITDVAFTDASTGWVLGRERDWWLQGEHNVLLKTTNGGFNWIQQINDTTCFLDAICFINQSTGWITGSRHISSDSAEIVLMKTTDGGNSWFPQSSPWAWNPEHWGNVDDHLAICFVDSLAGYLVTGNAAIGGLGWIVKTTDGGETWNEQLFSISWRDIAFSDAQNGIVVGSGVSDRFHWGVIYQTTNGGGEWQELVWEEYHTFQDVYVGNSNVITVVGYNKSFQPSYQTFGKILRSEDAGTSWMIQDSISNPLNGVSFIDDYTGWAVGDNGIILHTTNGGVSFIDDETTQPTEFILEQNYPNPFNPSTIISYQLPVGGNAIIKVYDILGNEIATLVNNYKPTGKYEVEFNASLLPSGVYFYQLRAGEYVQTRKMILLK